VIARQLHAFHHRLSCLALLLGCLPHHPELFSVVNIKLHKK
jgi:hypothetical protein